MASYREIVTKTVLGKAKKTFSNNYTLTPEEVPSTILGCWVINHKFEGKKEGSKIRLIGSSDINIWYAYDNDTKTLVTKQTVNYDELLNLPDKLTSELTNNTEIIIRSLKDPTCTKVEIKDNNIEYNIEKELGVELVGDSKVRIAVDENEDSWEDLSENTETKVMDEIDKSVDEDFLTKK